MYLKFFKNILKNTKLFIKMVNIVNNMPKLMLLALGIILSFSISANEKIRGHYKIVGNKTESKNIKKIIFEEFINFGCSHCNKLHKASKDFRKKFANQIEFFDIPIVFKGQDDSPLRLYYVARKIGKGDLIKDELFKATFVHGVNVFDPGITNYLARSLGIRKEFQEEKDQLWVNKLIQEGERKSIIYGVRGTPTVVIQHALKMDIGKYGSMDQFLKKIPETIEDLMY